MADFQNEIQSISDFVASELTGATFKMQNTPSSYKANELSIELAISSRTTETSFHYRLNRTYQLVYFGTSKFDCMSKLQAIERKINDKQIIPLGSTGRYLRVTSFSLSQAFKTDTAGVFAVIGMLEAEIREARTQAEYQKINVVNTKTTTN